MLLDAAIAVSSLGLVDPSLEKPALEPRPGSTVAIENGSTGGSRYAARGDVAAIKPSLRWPRRCRMQRVRSRPPAAAGFADATAPPNARRDGRPSPGSAWSGRSRGSSHGTLRHRRAVPARAGSRADAGAIAARAIRMRAGSRRARAIRAVALAGERRSAVGLHRHVRV